METNNYVKDADEINMLCLELIQNYGRVLQSVVIIILNSMKYGNISLL